MILAVLLLAIFAVAANTAGVHKAAHACKVTLFETRDLGANAFHTPYYLVPWNHGIDRIAPLVARLMYI
jgi:hypothetical protein